MEVKGIREIARHLPFFEYLAGFHSRRVSYSQFGEDLVLASFYGRLQHDKGVRVRRGCIVDVGAYRPILHSNSYYFYKRGWRCINIDATPGSMKRFRETRPRDANIEAAISRCEGRSLFYMFGSPSLWNTMDEVAAHEASARTGISPEVISVSVLKLETILDEHLGSMPFEILSIDAEGVDVEVLQSVNFERYRPRVVLVETLGASAESLRDHPVYKYMSDRDYALYAWVNPNLMFVRNDSAV